MSGEIFKCEICPSKPGFSTLGESALHQKLHSNVKNFKFQCKWESCGFLFLTYKALDIHISRFHSSHRHTPPGAPSCPCSFPNCEQLFSSKRLLCRHLMSFHIQEQGEKIKCPFQEVCKSNNDFPLNSFRVHLSQKHKGWNSSCAVQDSFAALNLASENQEYDCASINSDADNSVNMDFDCNAGNDLNASTESIHQDTAQDNILLGMKEDFYKNLAMLYLRLEAEKHVPVSTINIITETLAELTTASQLIVKKTIERELTNLKVTDVDCRDRFINSVLHADSMYACHQTFPTVPSMLTNARRKTYYRKNFGYIKPKEVNLSKDVNEPRCIFYVPPRKTLEALLTVPTVRKEILQSFNRTEEEGVIKDYIDGSLEKERRQASNNEQTIDVYVYQDAFTATRDLSSVANFNDILGMYMTLANLSPHLRSKISSIQLLMLIPGFKQMFNDHKVKCFKKIAEKFLELQQNGIQFEGRQYSVQAKFILGDNKGQHEIGGFIRSFSHDFFCRFCPMSKKEILAEPWQVAPLRTAESYEEASRSVPPGRATCMGVSGPDWQCPFNILEGYHVCDPSLPPCLAHDIYEGILNYDFAPIVKHLIDENWVTIDVFNRRVRRFKYIDRDLGNKPAPFTGEKKNTHAGSTKEFKVGGHAVQNWTLLRLLPFILGDLIKDPDDVYWQLYLLLKKIVDYLCAPAITLEQLSHLKILTENYLVDREELVGAGKPKHHYFAHYPDLIEIMGPIYFLQTMRFESAHQWFKEAIRSGHNFINLGSKLAKKYCLYFSYLCAGAPFTEGVQVLEEGMSIPAFLATGTCNDSILSAFNAKNIGEDALIMTSVIVDEVLLKAGKWLLLGNGDDGIIIVGRIKFVVLDGLQVYLLLEKYVANSLDNIGIYVVQAQDSPDVSCIPMAEIKYPCPHSMYEWGDYDVCFSLKHTLAYKA